MQVTWQIKSCALGALALGAVLAFWPDGHSPVASAGETSPNFRRVRVINRSGRKLTKVNMSATPVAGASTPIIANGTIEQKEGVIRDAGKHHEPGQLFAPLDDIKMVTIGWEWDFGVSGGGVQKAMAKVELMGKFGADRLEEFVLVLHPSTTETEALEAARWTVYAWYGDDMPGANEDRYELIGTLVDVP